MKRLLALLLIALGATLLGGCATPPATGPRTALLHDEAFAPRHERFDPDSLFALTPSMQRYLQQHLTVRDTVRDPRRALLDALYTNGELRLQYDGAVTRNASEAFEARAGNCLSLVIMTAAFAKHMGLPVSFREVMVDQYYRRAGGLTLASGHVNLVLGPPPVRSAVYSAADMGLIVDFIARDELQRLRSVPLNESTVVAMYLNNRAAEALAEGRLDDGYWWAREALMQDPAFIEPANTLGVIYSRAGHALAAEAALRHVLAHAPDHVAALSNLSSLLMREGRTAEAQALQARLAQKQPVAPFHFYELGRQAMAAGDFAAATRHFERELRQQPFQDEVHFWAAQAAWRQGDHEGTARHLGQARDHSATRDNQARYAAKLEHLRAQTLH
jgi:Tfp pilus assembly protein PilF